MMIPSCSSRSRSMDPSMSLLAACSAWRCREMAGHASRSSQQPPDCINLDAYGQTACRIKRTTDTYMENHMLTAQDDD
jgi:hypothetical protein